MREAGSGRMTRVVGRLLPASVRELVFEPLCSDLIHRYVSEGRTGWGRLQLILGVTRAFGESAVAGFPRYFHDRGRTTVVGRVSLTIGGGGLLVLVALLVPWILTVARVAGVW